MFSYWGLRTPGSGVFTKSKPPVRAGHCASLNDSSIPACMSVWPQAAIRTEFVSWQPKGNSSQNPKICSRALCTGIPRLDEKAAYSESDLEFAIINKLENFLLEMGKGFLFEARQKRFTFDEEHFFVDLVFYNRLLRCYVLIDLKIGKLTHQHLGQMQMYVNYFDRFVKHSDERPTIGIILCKKKHDALVEITLPQEANIHAREYQLYLPDKELLRRKLVEWSEEAEKLEEKK
jgi:hypothetical protein